jgi:hypothetical protein
LQTSEVVRDLGEVLGVYPQAECERH